MQFYLYLLLNSFMSHLPISDRSESVLYAVAAFPGYNVWIAAGVALIGTLLAHFVTYLLGVYLSTLKDKNWFALREDQYTKAQAYALRYAIWLLLIAGFPLYPALVLIVGFFRAPVWQVLALAAAGQVLHYAYGLTTVVQLTQ